MKSNRDNNIDIFKSTKMLYETNEKLKDCIKYSKQYQKFWPEGSVPEADISQASKAGHIVVSKLRSYEASEKYSKAGNKVAVHNFASATTPGGGVLKGSSAQEECLCRISTLYPAINEVKMWDKFYTPHRNGLSPIHNDDIIYTPDVCVFKTDNANPTLMPEKDWYKVDVITCAAPNLRENPNNAYNAESTDTQVSLSDEELYKVHYQRALAMLNLAVKKGVDVLILGAFGCGAFRNNPQVVVKVYKDILIDKGYAKFFDTVEFAVFCTPRDESNYTVFNSAFSA